MPSIKSELSTMMFFGSASAIVGASMMIAMKENFGGLVENNQLGCGGTAFESCKLNKSYGSGILAVHVLSVGFNAMLLLYMLTRGRKLLNKSWAGKGLFGLVGLSVLMAIAAAGYAMYIQQNFGKQNTNGGIECADAGNTFTDCQKLGGQNTRVFLGLSGTSLALSGLVMLFMLGLGMSNMSLRSTTRDLFSKVDNDLDKL